MSGSIGSRHSSWKTALELLENGQVRVDLLASEPLPLSEWHEAFERFEKWEGLKGLMKPQVGQGSKETG